MGIFADEMARHTGVATTGYVAADGTPGSPYSPLVDGNLIQVKVGVAGDAVTSLLENVSVKLECAGLWGVPLYVTTDGANIRTAPAFPIPKGVQNCKLPVKSDKKITVEIEHVTGATPVTPRIQVIGVFEY